MLISGVEAHEQDEPLKEKPGRYRIYVGPRWRWRYILVGAEEGERILRAFHSTYHLFGRIPEGAQVFEVPEAERELESDRDF